MARLSRDFFDRDTLTVSRELLGKYLCRRLESGELLALRLTETEAYIGRRDKACHAYGGRRTARTEPLFLPPGHAYIYLIYGMYHCLNLVTERACRRAPPGRGSRPGRGYHPPLSLWGRPVERLPAEEFPQRARKAL